jgi:hypothetical protein
VASKEPKNFIARNEGFTCEACSFAVPPAAGTYRNHCPQCLTAKHVDDKIPGDRQSRCGGRMPTIAIEGSDIDTLDLVQRCDNCGIVRRNRIAGDDSRAATVAVISRRA